MINFIDSNCMVGRRMFCREGSPKTTEDIINIMDRAGIDKSVAFHSVAKENDPKTGNDFLEDEIGGNDRFIRQWIVMPDCCGDFYKTDALKELLIKREVKSVRMRQSAMGSSWAEFVTGELMKMLTELKIPVFIDKETISWEELYSFCTRWSEINFVICNVGYRSDRVIIPLLKACKNVYIETSTFLSNEGISRVCGECGAKRIVFGSGTPNFSACAAVSLIRYAAISDEEKRMIAYGNILKLMGEASI